MKRKAVKLSLFIFGAVVFVFWTILYLLTMSSLFIDIDAFWEWTLLEMMAIALVAVVPMSIAMLMHAKDIIQRKKGFAIFLIVLAIFWLANSALLITGMVIVMLIFGWDTYSFALQNNQFLICTLSQIHL